MILSKLVNSTKHLKDQNKKRLSKRIRRSSEISSRLERKSYQKTSQFIRTHALQMVTFAKVTLTMNVRIPYMSNPIEKLMGEISKRCKHKWAHWSTTGLTDIFYCSQRYPRLRRFCSTLSCSSFENGVSEEVVLVSSGELFSRSNFSSSLKT
jgi:hypothetical protein